jgi:hypothetical protein
MQISLKRIANDLIKKMDAKWEKEAVRILGYVNMWSEPLSLTENLN